MTSAERSSSSRRRVTSSRFPIGVAQTASGTVLPGGVEGDETGAEQARSRPELCAHDRHSVARAGERFTPQNLARRMEYEVACGREPAADHDEVRVEDVHEAADAGAEVTADAVKNLDRTGFPLVRQAYKPMRVDRRAELLRRELPGRDPGDVRLKMPAPGARALTGKAVVHDHDVPELGPATEELTVDDRAAPATRPEGEHDHRVDVARGTETELGVGRRVRVV